MDWATVCTIMVYPTSWMNFALPKILHKLQRTLLAESNTSAFEREDQVWHHIGGDTHSFVWIMTAIYDNVRNKSVYTKNLIQVSSYWCAFLSKTCVSQTTASLMPLRLLNFLFLCKWRCCTCNLTFIGFIKVTLPPLCTATDNLDSTAPKVPEPLHVVLLTYP